MSTIPPQEAFGFQEENPLIQSNSLSPVNGNWETQQSAAMKERPSIFHIGSDTPPRNGVSLPQQAGFSLLNPAVTGPNLFPPISVDSFCQELSSPGLDSSLLYGDHPFVASPPSRTRAELDLSLIGGNQMGIPHSNRSPVMGAVNTGHSFFVNQLPMPPNFGETRPYNLPVTNFTPGLPQSTLPGGDAGLSFRNQITMNPPLNQTVSQEIQSPGILSPNSGQNAFYNFAGAGSSSQCQALNANGMGSQMFPLHGEDLSGTNQNKRRMIENSPNLGQLGSASMPATARTDPMMPMGWQSNNYIPHSAMPTPNLHLGGSWLTQSRSSERLTTTTSDGQTIRPRPIKNSVYDPMYEQMGLPIDPHLRMFLATQRDGL